LRAGVRLDSALLGEGDELSLGNALVKLVDFRRPAWRVHERLHEELYLDAATGLSNRRNFQRRTEAAIASLRPEQPLGAAYLELGGADEATGERIAALGRILRDLQRGGLVAAHFGAGRFGALLPGACQPALGRFAESVLGAAEAVGAAPDRLGINIGGVSDTAPPSAFALLCAAEDACLVARTEQRPFFLLNRPGAAAAAPRQPVIGEPRGRFAIRQ
jgi:GGDEF domain-containing protein